MNNSSLSDGTSSGIYELLEEGISVNSSVELCPEERDAMNALYGELKSISDSLQDIAYSLRKIVKDK